MHYVAHVDATGLEEPPDTYCARLNLSEVAELLVYDETPFYAMCEMVRTLKDLGVKGTLEGMYEGEPLFDPFNGNGLPLA